MISMRIAKHAALSTHCQPSIVAQGPRAASPRGQHQQPSRRLDATPKAMEAAGDSASRASAVSGNSSRRMLLSGAVASTVFASLQLQDVLAVAEQVSSLKIQIDLTPDQSLYDPSDSRLRSAAQLLQKALNAEDVAQEEALWTSLIDEYKSEKAIWADDVVGRALGNRGNARARQGRLEEALQDYNAAIERCPWSVDPVLNRGVVFETLGRYDEAKRDYEAVLAVNPTDAAAWNNLGNVNAASLDWKGAFTCYDKAVQLAPQFSFAAANRALARFEGGEQEEAIRDMRTLLRRYPEFPDMRAALTAALWSIGKEGEAESNWGRVSDVRYKDLTWLIYERRWPPSLVRSLSAFLNIDSV